MPTNEAQQELLTYGDVAERLRCSRSTVYSLVSSGQLRAVPFGARQRVRRADLADYLAGLKPTASR